MVLTFGIDVVRSCIGERKEWFQPSKETITSVQGGEGKKRISKAIMMGGWRKVCGDANQKGGETCAMEMGFHATPVE